MRRTLNHPGHKRAAQTAPRGGTAGLKLLLRTCELSETETDWHPVEHATPPRPLTPQIVTVKTRQV